MSRLLNKKGMGLLSILLALSMIGLIYYFAAKNSRGPNKAKDNYFKQSSLDASSYKNTLNSTNMILKDAVAAHSKQTSE